MTEIKGGGAAFPGCVRNTKGKLDRNPGMSLRDWFAGQVISSVKGWHPADRNGKTSAELAYEIADEMLKVRENSND